MDETAPEDGTNVRLLVNEAPLVRLISYPEDAVSVRLFVRETAETE